MEAKTADKKAGWYRSGKALLDEMKNTTLPEGMIAIWYLGQAGFAIKSGGILYGIDLYLRDSESRQLPVPFTPAEAAGGFDYALCTHNHEDHLDEVTVRGMAAAGNRTVFVVPAPFASLTQSYGVPADHVIGAKAWEKVSLRGAELTPTPAAHESFAFDEAGNHEFLGFLLDMPGAKLYHSGDTIEWESMTEEIKPLQADIMCLPINGSDWKRKKRNIIGNLDAREAADIADECGADLVIPMHFDMFAGNGENPAHFADYMYRDHKGLKYHVMVPGERFLYAKGTVL